MKTLNVLLVALVVCFAITTATQAELTDLTGNSYGWVSYNNSHTGSNLASNNAPETNTTDLTVDTDTGSSNLWSGQANTGSTTGTLVDFGGSGNTASFTHTWTGSQNFAVTNNVALGGATPGDTVFGDVLTTSYSGSIVLHTDATTQTLTFSGLTDDTLYDFVAISQTANWTDSWSQGSILGADSSTEAGVQSGNGAATLTGLTTDILRWDDIDPGADGAFSIELDAINHSTQSSNVSGIDAFALGEQASQVNGVPEPSSFVLGLLGLLGFAFTGRRRVKRS